MTLTQQQHFGRGFKECGKLCQRGKKSPNNQKCYITKTTKK